MRGSHSDWKTWKNGKAFSSREKSGNFDQTGKVRGNHRKYWKIHRISDKYYVLFFSDIQINCVYLLKWIKFSVKKTKL